jgi:hypothetical protein
VQRGSDGHHVDERPAIRVPHEQRVVPVVGVVVADRDARDVTGPQDRAAAPLEARDDAAAVAELGTEARPAAVGRVLAVAHEVEHHDRPRAVPGGQRGEVLRARFDGRGW